MSELMLLVLLKVAYLATGLTLCVVGKKLIEKKLETKFEGEGSVAKTSFKLITTSPGLVFLIAGLVVIGAAIFQQSQIMEAYSKAELQTLVEKARTIRFAAESETSRRVEADMKRAQVLAAEGKVDEAAVHLSVAVIIQPDILGVIASDPAYASVLQQRQFNTIVQARFELPLHTISVPTAALSPIAQEVLRQLRTLAKRQELQDAQALEARTIAHSIPSTRGVEPKENIVRRLVELVDKSPHVLLEQLSSTEKRWILDDPELVSALEADLDRRIKNE